VLPIFIKVEKWSNSKSFYNILYIVRCFLWHYKTKICILVFWYLFKSLIFSKILEKFLAWFFLNKWKSFWKITKIDRRFSSINRERSNIGIWRNNWVVKNNRIICNNNSLVKYTIFTNFDKITNRYWLQDSSFIHKDIVTYIIISIPIETGTYFSYLFWRLVGGLMITISDKITYFPMLTFAKSPRRIILCWRIAWSQI